MPWRSARRCRVACGGPDRGGTDGRSPGRGAGRPARTVTAGVKICPSGSPRRNARAATKRVRREHRGMRMPRMNDRAPASVTFWLASEIMPASATTGVAKQCYASAPIHVRASLTNLASAACGATASFASHVKARRWTGPTCSSGGLVPVDVNPNTPARDTR
jgi:hypothetical protein